MIRPYITGDSRSDAWRCQRCWSSKQILGSSPSQERPGLRGGEEGNRQGSSGCPGGAALQSLEVKGAKVGKVRAEKQESTQRLQK